QLSGKNYTAASMINCQADFDELFEAMEGLQVNWQKVKAHSDNRGNDTSDCLSKTGRKLPYDNCQLYESIKTRLNLAPNSTFERMNCPDRYTSGLYNPTLSKIIDVILVPIHFTDANILALFKGQAQIIASKNLDKGATRDLSIRVPLRTYQ